MKKTSLKLLYLHAPVEVTEFLWNHFRPCYQVVFLFSLNYFNDLFILSCHPGPFNANALAFHTEVGPGIK